MPIQNYGTQFVKCCHRFATSALTVVALFLIVFVTSLNNKEIYEMYTGFCCRNLMERDHFEKQGLVWRIILEWIFKNWVGDIERIDLDQDRNRWRALGMRQ